WSVTGVQTCALPIWGALSRYQRGRIVRLDPGQDRPATAAGAGRRAGGDPAPARRPQAERGPGGPPGEHAGERRPAAQAPRPEEDRMMPVLLPMLATPAAPFDAPEYLFEVKWDGVRALAAVEAGHWRRAARGLLRTLRSPFRSGASALAGNAPAAAGALARAAGPGERAGAGVFRRGRRVRARVLRRGGGPEA